MLRGKNYLIKKILSMSLSLIMIYSYIYDPVAMALDVAERHQSKSELQQKRQALSKELQAAKDDVQKEAKNKNALDRQINVVQEEIDTSNRYITALENEITDMERQITEIRADMDHKIVLLKKSLASTYVAGDTSTLDIILGAKDFEDFLDKADIVKSVSRTIKKLIDDLNTDLENVQKREKEIISDKDEREKEKAELEKKRFELQDLVEQSEQLLSELEQSEQGVKRQIDQNDAEVRAIDSQIQKYYEEQRRKQEAVTHKGGFVWPVPGYHHITSGFNDCESRSHVHGAIDIGGDRVNGSIYGANVVASGSGTVIIANTDGRGGGYGNYVVIDHGNGRSTLYGHLSSVCVRKGQSISQSECIGHAGNTGFSTGPHVHFEYRVNGVRTDPHAIVAY